MKIRSYLQTYFQHRLHWHNIQWWWFFQRRMSVTVSPSDDMRLTQVWITIYRATDSNMRLPHLINHHRKQSAIPILGHWKFPVVLSSNLSSIVVGWLIQMPCAVWWFCSFPYFPHFIDLIIKCNVLPDLCSWLSKYLSVYSNIYNKWWQEESDI